MRFSGLLLFLITTLGLSGCGNSLHSQTPPAKWTTGFWFWPGGAADLLPQSPPVDALYVHVGTINKNVGRGASVNWFVSGSLPDELPEAREYWVVFRYEHQEVPDKATAAMLARRVSQLREQARQQHRSVVGVQLDIDSPTGALPQYASFLREVRKNLPQGVQISITGLLDWFREGTAIAEVIKETDEFVPQFYDIAPTLRPAGVTGIAAPIDAAKWGPRFSRFGKRFRIGVSVFGRARFVQRENTPQSQYQRLSSFRDLAPLEIASNPAFNLQATRNGANELVLNYRATRNVAIDWNRFEAGDTLQFTLATTETIRAAVESARRMRGCAGVVFFRWPGWNDSLVMQPDEAMMAAGVVPQSSKKPSITVIDGGCAAVKCVDVYLMNGNPLLQNQARYRIHSSIELEYFLPEKKMPVRMTGPSTLELSLPPHCGQHRMYLGRAVTAKSAEYSVEEPQ